MDITDISQMLKFQDIIQVLKFQMFTWMLQQRDLWIAYEHGRVQMNASVEGLVAAHGHPETTMQIDTEAGELS